MSVIRQFPSLSKLFSFYEEIPDETLHETETDSFYRNSVNLFRSQHRKAWVSKGSNKKIFAINFFQFCDSKIRQRHLLQEEKKLSIELGSLVNSLGHFPKTFDQAGKCIRIPLPKSEDEIGSENSRENIFSHFSKISVNVQIFEFACQSDMKTTNFALLLSENWTYTLIISSL